MNYFPLLLMLISASTLANPDKARTEYNRCLAELSTEQRRLDKVLYTTNSRCDNTGVCIEVSIGASVSGAWRDAFTKSQDCMMHLDNYETACKESDKNCEFKTFDEVYRSGR